MTPSIQAFLDNPVPEGERNRSLVYALCQCRDNGVDPGAIIHKSITVDHYPEREAESVLRSIYNTEARPPSEGAGGGDRAPIQHTYTNAQRPLYHINDEGNICYHYDPNRPTQPPEAAAGEVGPVVPQGAYDTTDLEPLPEPIENGTVEFLKSVFDEGDLISIATEVYTDGGSIPRGGGDTIDRDVLINRLESSSDPMGLWDGTRNGGVFVRVNAMMDGGESDHEVAKYEHALLEWDNIPLEQQWALMKKSEIPIACVIFSGGDSLHAWVKVGAQNRQEFEERVLVLHEHFKAYDPDAANKNPSRFSRLPGALRRSREDHNVGEVQSLISLKRGARNWDEWLEFLKDADLPQAYDMDELYSMDPSEDPTAMIGRDRYMCRGSGGLLVGPSGIGKSSFTMQMAVSFSDAIPFFGMPIREPLTVLVIQAENDKGDLAEQFQGVVAGMGLTPEQIERVKRRIKIVPDKTSSGASFVKRLERLIRKYEADVVLADPLVSYAGCDISKQDTMAAFLRNGGINDVIERTNAMLWWVHHTGKPPRGTEKNADANMSLGDYSYIGLGSSDLTNWARSIMVLKEVGNNGTNEMADEDRLFELILPKRGKRAGFRDIDGNLVSNKLYLKHAEGRICWEQAAAPVEENESDGPSNAQRIIETSFTVTDLEIQTRYNMYTDQGNAPAIAAYHSSIDFREANEMVRASTIWQRLNPVNHRSQIGMRVRVLAQFFMQRDRIEMIEAVSMAGGEWGANEATISSARRALTPQ